MKRQAYKALLHLFEWHSLQTTDYLVFEIHETREHDLKA